MAFRRNKTGLDISGVNKRRGPALGGSGRKHGLSSGPSNQNRSAMSRAAKGRDTYIHPSSYGRERRFSRKSIVVTLLIIVASVALAVGVGALVYDHILRNSVKATLNTSALDSVLSEPANAKDPYWCVLVETDASSAEQGRGAISNLGLMCIDPDNIALSILWIPTDTRVYIDGYGYQQIEEAFSLEGEVGIVAAVEKLANIDATHYLELNQAGLAKLENDLSPLSVDPSSAGRDMLTTALCRKIFGSSSEQITSITTTITNCMATDASFDEVKSCVTALHGINIDSSCNLADMPAQTQTIDGQQCKVVDSDSWNTMVMRVNNGMSPVADATEVGTNKVIRDKCTVAVWNGVGVSGVASDCANELKKLGWNVISTGNAAQFVYEETFVVYKDTDDEPAARLLASDLGQGRVVRSAARYSYTGNLLVVVGKDYKPY